ncbi:FG-GAP-like repeat-containing protein [Schlesneria sp. T3-172]|uniref:FG-GAP-like repeat-containing protein n=1 Tax=Schlesneria sphaerica TaxID=3373610 RepID=UPI0037C7DF24
MSTSDDRPKPVPLATRSHKTRPWLLPLLIVIGIAGATAVAFKVFNANPTADELLEQSQTALDQRDYAQAVSTLERAVEQYPDLKEAWALLADASAREGDASRSLTALEQLVRLDPARASSLAVQLGRNWMTRNLIRPAINTLRLASVANPNAAEPDRYLAQIFAVTGHRAEVVECLVRLIQKNAFTQDDLVVLSSVNPTVDDSGRLELMLKADPNEKSPLLPQAMHELDRNRVSEAEQYLLEVVKADPGDNEAQSILGEIYADFAPEKFLAWNAQLPPTSENDGRIWLARAKWLNLNGKPDPAIRCLHEALVREPESLSANMLMGQVLKSRGLAELGTSYTERARSLQRITDLSSRMGEPQSHLLIEPMISELAATGRLWEAWGWAEVYDRRVRPATGDPMLARKKELAAQAALAGPTRTKPGSLAGDKSEWLKYPLPDWTQSASSPAGSEPTREGESTEIRFVDQAELAGLDFRYINTSAQESGHKIYETMGAGVAVLDFDQDGWPDLYFAQGKPLPLSSPTGPSDALYRNHRGERFESVTVPAGIDETSYSQGVTVGDYNNDGFPDIYVANLGRNKLFCNCGDGTFRDVTDEAGIQESAWTVSCAIADLNGDGLPEIFDVNYCEGQDFLTATCYDEFRRPVVCRPTMFNAALDTVAVNLGDGRFQELQAEAGLDLPLGMGLGLVIGDFNDDHRPDVFIANDMTANFLLINQTEQAGGALRFVDEAFLRGVALDANGLAQACMGIATWDVNRDGKLDLFITNFARESNTLYLSQAGDVYEDQTQRAGLRKPTFEPLGFGTQFIDADRDGRPELVVMNGHIDEFLNEPFRMKAQIFHGLDDARFVEISDQVGGEFWRDERLARGLALIDWNRDGLTDFVATDLEKPVLLATNATENQCHSLCLKLIGTQSSRDAIGAKIRVVLQNGEERIAQLTGGDGYESCSERVVSIGVSRDERVNKIEVQWPSGHKDVFENVAVAAKWLAIESRSTLVEFNSDR